MTSRELSLTVVVSSLDCFASLAMTRSLDSGTSPRMTEFVSSSVGIASAGRSIDSSPSGISRVTVFTVESPILNSTKSGAPPHWKNLPLP
jgi:hypothetical protein